MIARTEIDKCFSTALNGHGAFNFDNEVEDIFRKVERVAVYA